MKKSELVQIEIELDRETKILLLSVLRQGHFTKENVNALMEVFNINRPMIKLSNGTLIEI